MAKRFIKENADGKIIAVSQVSQGSDWRAIDETDSQLQEFLLGMREDSLQLLANTDQAMSRVVEDLIGLLVDQGTIRFTDLPQAAQEKLLSRREMRGNATGMDLLDDVDDLKI